MDWRPWEVSFGRPTPASLRALGLCENVIAAFTEDFHFIDVNGDGKADLVYSGSFVECNRAHESDRTIIYLNTDGRLRLVFSGTGRLVKIWRDSPLHAIGFVLRDESGMDPEYLLYTYLPRRLNGEWTFHLATLLAGRRETPLPPTTFAQGRPFRVAQDRYNLRVSPVVDDSSVTEDQAARGNVVATFAKGSSGIALSERVDTTGRTWWFVIMQSAKVGEHVPLGSPGPIWRIGWMSSRFLIRDSTTATGPIDTAFVVRRPP